MANLLRIFEFYKNYFAIFDYITKNKIGEFTVLFIQKWICMPEWNLEYHLKNNNIKYAIVIDDTESITLSSERDNLIELCKLK